MSAKECGIFRGIYFGNDISISHVLFVDDIVTVSDGSEQSLSTLYEILFIFCNATRMLINGDKSTILHTGLDESELITV